MKITSEACRRVAQSLLAEGPATAPELAERLGLTAAGVRRHLDSLETDELIVAGDRPPFGPAPQRGRGRPPRIYAITEHGRDAFEQSYDDLATAALRFVREQNGEQAVVEFARRRAEEMHRRYLPLVSKVDDLRGRADVLVSAMTQDGFAASVSATPVDGAAATVQICQHNCPVAHVASEFPQLCDLETEALSALLGTHVTRLATIAHGDGVCTTVVPGTVRTTRATTSRTRITSLHRATDAAAAAERIPS